MYSYYINGEKVSENIFIAELENENYINCESHFEDYLNETHEPVTLAGGHYNYGTVLRKVDALAYKILLDDFADDRYKSILNDLKHGSKYEIYDNIFEIKADNSLDDLLEDLLQEEQEQM